MSFTKVQSRKEGTTISAPAPVHVHRHYSLDLSPIDDLLEKHECAIEDIQAQLDSLYNGDVGAELESLCRDFEDLAKKVSSQDLTICDNHVDTASALEALQEHVNEVIDSLNGTQNSVYLLDAAYLRQSGQLLSIADSIAQLETKITAIPKPVKPSQWPYYIAITLSSAAIILGLVNVL